MRVNNLHGANIGEKKINSDRSWYNEAKKIKVSLSLKMGNVNLQIETRETIYCIVSHIFIKKLRLN